MQSKYRLLVVRLGAMGDILHALPSITALRQAHPTWQIDWVVEPRWQALLAVPGTTERGAQMPVVDRLHFAPTKDWRKGPLSRRTITSVTSLRSQLKAATYDAVIDVQGAMRSAVLARMAGCPRVIGEAMPRETAARLLFSEQVITHGAHVIEQDIELAQPSPAMYCSGFRPCCPWTRQPKRGAMRCLLQAERGPLRSSIPARAGEPRCGRLSDTPRWLAA